MDQHSQILWKGCFSFFSVPKSVGGITTSASCKAVELQSAIFEMAATEVKGQIRDGPIARFFP